MPRGLDYALTNAHVKRLALDINNEPIGVAHSNPLLDSRQYEVEYADGYSETLSANVIAENLLSQVDDDGYRQRMFTEISDHRVLPNAVPKADRKFTTARGL